ncbi:MAG: GNAT family N-acetyltransferase [Pseudomonadota bacterium]
MTQPIISSAATSERAKITRTITLGFVADPVARWVWPDPDAYLETMPNFAEAFGGRGFEHGSIYVADGGKAAAMWLPPDIEPDGEAIEAIIGETVPEARMEEVAAFFDQMDVFHPVERCWYLPLIAADPAFTGRGLGASLMKYALQYCDNDNLPAYLESSNPRNISLYERHGFEKIGEIQVGSSPIMTPMLRQPCR